MTLQTSPAAIYRALMESLAFGLRRMVSAAREVHIPLEALHLSGGIAAKNPHFMQILSDVLGLPLYGNGVASAPAVGMAILAAVAAGAYPSVTAASARMNCLSGRVFRPNVDNMRLYDRLYADYIVLYDYFGRGDNPVMKRLRALRGK